MPQRRNHTARSSYGGRTVALRWPWGGIRFLPCPGCLENRTAASWRPCGGLRAPLRRPYGKLVIAARTVRSPYGHLPVCLRSPYGFWFHESYDRRAVAVTICDHNYRRPQDLTIFKNHVLPTVDRRTVRWPYGGSMICDRGIIRMQSWIINRSCSALWWWLHSSHRCSINAFVGRLWKPFNQYTFRVKDGFMCQYSVGRNVFIKSLFVRIIHACTIWEEK